MLRKWFSVSFIDLAIEVSYRCRSGIRCPSQNFFAYGRFQYLSNGAAGQNVKNMYLFWCFHGTELLLHEANHLTRRHACSAANLDSGVQGFAPFRVRNSDYRTIGHPGMTRQGSFDIARIDVEPAADNYVSQPVPNEQIAAVIEDPGIPGSQPAIDEYLECFFLCLVITAHDEITADGDLALLALR